MAGRREKLKYDRNNLILEAAAKLFRREGYETAKMASIATACEISIGTIYNYYHNKGDLLVAIVAKEVHEVLQSGQEIVNSPPHDLTKAVTSLMDVYYNHSLVYLNKEMWRAAMSISTQQPQSPFGMAYSKLDVALTRQTCKLISKLKTLGLVRINCDTKAAGELIFNNLNMMFVGFVKSENMTLASLRAQVRKQTKLITTAISA